MYAFFGWSGFYRNWGDIRLLNITGHMGTGKTLLSVALGFELLRRGLVERFSSNFPCCLSKAPARRYCAAVLDEGAQLFDARDSYKNKALNELSRGITARLRKDGSYLMAPSFIDIDKRFRDGMRVWRVLKVARFWFYSWEYGPEEVEERRTGLNGNYDCGKLILFNPSHFFGWYDTWFWPSPDLSQAFVGELLRGS
jgi:hypothetical protein